MLRFIIRRLIITIPTILVVITITWGLIRLAPGNFYTGEKRIPAAIEKNIREKYGLDKPWYEQYLRTMRHILTLDFGTSLKYEGQSVNSIIARSLPVLGTISEQKRGSACAYAFSALHGLHREVDAGGHAGSAQLRLHSDSSLEGFK